MSREVIPRPFVVIILGLLALFLFRWLYADYWIATHCTMVMGTRVCQ